MARIIAFGWIVIFASHSALADHWISVGSFKNRDMAEKGLLQAQAKTTEPLSVVASSSNNAGINYRVSAGPYATRAAAKNALLILSSAGFSGAWIWELKQFASPQDNDALSAQAGMNASDRVLDLELLSLPEFDDAVLAREARAAESMRAAKQPATDELAEQAPPGYQLHRLRRE